MSKEPLEQVETKIFKTSENLASKFNNNFTPENIEKIQSIIIQSMIEIVSEVCFSRNFDITIGKSLISQVSSNLQLFNKSGLPGTIWETMEKLVTEKLEGNEFETIFDFVRLRILGKLEMKKEKCCC